MCQYQSLYVSCRYFYIFLFLYKVYKTVKSQDFPFLAKTCQGNPSTFAQCSCVSCCSNHYHSGYEPKSLNMASEEKPIHKENPLGISEQLDYRTWHKPQTRLSSEQTPLYFVQPGHNRSEERPQQSWASEVMVEASFTLSLPLCLDVIRLWLNVFRWQIWNERWESMLPTGHESQHAIICWCRLCAAGLVSSLPVRRLHFLNSGLHAPLHPPQTLAKKSCLLSKPRKHSYISSPWKQEKHREQVGTGAFRQRGEWVSLPPPPTTAQRHDLIQRFFTSMIIWLQSVYFSSFTSFGTRGKGETGRTLSLV